VEAGRGRNGARDEASPDNTRDGAENSDIDLAAEFNPAAEMDLIRPVSLERWIGLALGRAVATLPESVETPRLRANPILSGSANCLLYRSPFASSVATLSGSAGSRFGWEPRVRASAPLPLA
jgi:hypothetical protein